LANIKNFARFASIKEKKKLLTKSSLSFPPPIKTLLGTREESTDKQAKNILFIRVSRIVLPFVPVSYRFPVQKGGSNMVNKVILVGRLGADPEVRYTPDGTMIVNFRIATDESYKNKQGEKVSKAEWHRIVVFGKLAEICGNYLGKGRLVFIEGRLQTRTWDDKDGNKRSITEIIANNMQMLEPKGQGGRTPDMSVNEPSTHYEEEPIPDDIPF